MTDQQVKEMLMYNSYKFKRKITRGVYDLGWEYRTIQAKTYFLAHAIIGYDWQLETITKPE